MWRLGCISVYLSSVEYSCEIGFAVASLLSCVCVFDQFCSSEKLLIINIVGSVDITIDLTFRC